MFTAVMSCVLLSGCAKTFEVGMANPGSQRQSFDGSYSTSSDGRVPAAAWPDTCSLLTAADVSAILPQASHITPKRLSVKVVVFDFAGFGSTRETASGGECRLEYKLPSGGWGFIWLSIEDTGYPRRINQSMAKSIDLFHLVPAFQRLNLGVGRCFKATASWGTWYCHTQAVIFKAIFAVDTGMKIPNRRSLEEFFGDRVVPEFIRTVAARLPERAAPAG